MHACKVNYSMQVQLQMAVCEFIAERSEATNLDDGSPILS